jgi:serine-type D-Ala-D-Ala carboxypeptidase/endopeptidase (penicillin-binding protein 4)
VLLLGALVAAIALVVFTVRERHSHETPVQPSLEEASLSAPPYSSAFVRAGAPWTGGDAQKIKRLAQSTVAATAFPATTGVVLLDARTGDPLYMYNSSLSLVPASAIKLIVAAAALHDLGPDYRFETTTATDGSIRGGILNGNLYLVGGGDPELGSADLRAAVRELRDSGVRLIGGDVIADSTLYADETPNKTWDPEDLEYGWAAPPSALSIDNGAVQFTIAPDAGGGLAAIAIDPPGAAGRIIGGVRSASTDADNTIRIDPLPDASGFTLSGEIPYGEAQKYWRAIAQPSQTAATVMRTLLNQQGIAVAGTGITGKTPAGTTALWTHRSRPLAAIIKHMAYASDNHIAEQLLRAIGAQQSGLGSLDNGIGVERSFLESLGVDIAPLQIVDGSGLSAQNRVTARSLAAVLRSMLAGPDAARDAALLPAVGVDGTVRVRDLPADVLGKVLGKDGYIEGASSIAGYIKTAHHGVVIYVFLVNDWQNGFDAVWAGEDEMLARIARM